MANGRSRAAGCTELHNYKVPLKKNSTSLRDIPVCIYNKGPHS